VDDAAFVKCEFLASILNGKISAPHIANNSAYSLLGPMLGGYTVKDLIDAFKDENIAQDSEAVLQNILFVHDNFPTIADLRPPH
ncbi:hypothetical protein, partial [Campylobacter jejuni]|uniref:hypothetical protein n=1 Tax=Campylobacter jejuni TaxID=197 RepID=UPI00131A03F0